MKRNLLIAYVLLMAIFIPQFTPAQEKPVRHVLIFATTDYSKHENLSDLRDNITEAREFAKAAASHQAVKTLVHPVMENTPEAALYYQLEKILSGVQDRDELIVYVSGHGFEIAGMPEEGPFVATVDTRDKWLDIRALIRALGTRKVPRKLLVLDICRESIQEPGIGKNGTADFGEWRLKEQGIAPRLHGGMEARTKADEMRLCQYNLVVIHACQSGGKSLLSQGRSVFSKHFSDCLRAKNSEKASLEMVFHELKHRTESDTRKISNKAQIPVMDSYFGNQKGFERDWCIAKVENTDPDRRRPIPRRKSNESAGDSSEAVDPMRGRRPPILNEETRKYLKDKAQPFFQEGEKKLRNEGLPALGDLIEKLRK